MSALDILFVDDDGDFLQSLLRAISPMIAPRSLCAVSTASKALQIASERRPLVCIIDLCLDERRGIESGYELLAALQAIDPLQRILVLTGHGSTAFGIRAMELGASSFMDKTVQPEHLAALIKDALIQAELRREHRELLRNRHGVGDLFVTGVSAAHRHLIDQIDFAASTSQPVLLVGETGTGKSLCARLIHNRSRRAHQNFVHYHPNFGGGDLVQSELFGHMKGAFTGASEARNGVVVQADDGSLFIDELDEVPLETQIRLLDLLQEYRVRPVGSDRFLSVDCRFIAATNRPISEAVAGGKIRNDLYHRIAHCIIKVPPLRERREDIVPMARHFLARVQSRDSVNVFEFSDQAILICQEHSWPGNVRELQGIIETAALRAHYKGRSIIESHDLPLCKAELSTGSTSDQGAFHDRLEAFRRKLVEEALDSCAGNQVQAARLLGIDRGTVRRLSAERTLEVRELKT